MEPKDTKQELLDAAERLFAEHGFDNTSLRDITSKAGANLAAVHYHYGNKEGLIRAVFARRIVPLNKKRLEMLSRFQDESGTEPVAVEKILEAFLVPAMEMCSQNPNFMKLAGRVFSEPDRSVQRTFISHFDELVRRFQGALGQSLPHLPTKELLWRFHFLVGSMIHTVSNHGDLEFLTGGICKFSGHREMAERLIAFAASGMKAALPAPTRGEK